MPNDTVAQNVTTEFVQALIGRNALLTAELEAWKTKCLHYQDLFEQSIVAGTPESWYQIGQAEMNYDIASQQQQMATTPKKFTGSSLHDAAYTFSAMMTGAAVPSGATAARRRNRSTSPSVNTPNASLAGTSSTQTRGGKITDPVALEKRRAGLAKARATRAANKLALESSAVGSSS